MPKNWNKNGTNKLHSAGGASDTADDGGQDRGRETHT